MKSSEDVASRRDREVFSALVQTQLSRILASELFKSSAQHQLLLRTIVDESLAGHTDALKEVVLAKDVLGRPDYDPSRHTQVRVAVNAVRRKLSDYYKDGASDDTVRIEIPRGHYVAVFSELQPQPQASTKRRFWYLWAACVSGIVVLFALLWAMRSSSAPQTGVPVQLTFDIGWTSLPAVSKDGSVLVFNSDRGPRGDSNIWIQRNGRLPRQLTSNPAIDMTPDISPDGALVVFRSTRNGDGLWLISAEAKEDNAKLLTRSYSPRFSPDGEWIVYHGIDTDGSVHIFKIRHAGGLPKRIDYRTTEAAFPVWSPDGTQIVFVARSAVNEEYDLWIANATGGVGEPARPLGIRAKLQRQNLLPITYLGECPQDWVDNKLLFTTHQHESIMERWARPR
jgi:hypothetical protein